MRVPEDLLVSVEMHWIRQLQPKYNQVFKFLRRERTTPARPYGQGKKHKAFRFTDEFSKRLRKAAKKTKMTETAYLEQAAEDRFKKDDID